MKIKNSGNYRFTIMGDKLLTISHVKLQNCHGNRSIAQRQDGIEVNDEDVLCRTTAILEIFIEDTIGNL